MENYRDHKIMELIGKKSVKRTVAAAGIAMSLGGGMLPVNGNNEATNSNAIVYEQSGSVDDKYDNAINNILSNIWSVKTAEAAETISTSPIIHKMVIQTNSPYAEITNSISGDANALKKLDGTVTLVKGKNMVPVEFTQEMGYNMAVSKTKKTVTLTSDERKVVLTNGSKTMKVTENGKTKSVTMDTAMILDKNKDYAISISGFGKAVDATTQWDSVTKTIGVNYTKAEFAKVEKTTLATNELKYKALQNIAGGEFMNAEDFNNPLEKLSVGATVVYSSEANKAAEKKLVNKYISKITKIDTVYCIGGKAYLVRPQEYSNGVIRNLVYKLDTFKSVDDEKSKILYKDGFWGYNVIFIILKNV